MVLILLGCSGECASSASLWCRFEAGVARQAAVFHDQRVFDMFRCTAYVGVCRAEGASHASLGHRPRNVCISNLSAESVGSRAAGVEGEIHKSGRIVGSLAGA
jgi:hypothetical protein